MPLCGGREGRLEKVVARPSARSEQVSLSDFKTVVQADSLQCFIWHINLKHFLEPIFKHREISVKTLDFIFSEKWKLW